MVTGYSRQQIVLHWTIVVLLIVQFLAAEAMSEAFEAVERGLAPEPGFLGNVHIFVGAIIFGLMLWRLALRLGRGAPPPPAEEPERLRMLGTAAHWAFYGLLVLLPVTGAVAWYRQSEAAGEVHEVLRALLLLLVAVHVAAVAVHHWVWKTDLIDRMKHPQK